LCSAIDYDICEIKESNTILIRFINGI
jgi:hypothetical protein